jgi:uncharacterized protein (DUF736 family)
MALAVGEDYNSEHKRGRNYLSIIVASPFIGDMPSLLHCNDKQLVVSKLK